MGHLLWFPAYWKCEIKKGSPKTQPTYMWLKNTAYVNGTYVANRILCFYASTAYYYPRKWAQVHALAHDWYNACDTYFHLNQIFVGTDPLVWTPRRVPIADFSKVPYTNRQSTNKWMISKINAAIHFIIRNGHLRTLRTATEQTVRRSRSCLQCPVPILIGNRRYINGHREF